MANYSIGASETLRTRTPSPPLWRGDLEGSPERPRLRRGRIRRVLPQGITTAVSSWSILGRGGRLLRRLRRIRRVSQGRSTWSSTRMPTRAAGDGAHRVRHHHLQALLRRRRDRLSLFFATAPSAIEFHRGSSRRGRGAVVPSTSSIRTTWAAPTRTSSPSCSARSDHPKGRWHAFPGPATPAPPSPREQSWTRRSNRRNRGRHPLGRLLPGPGDDPPAVAGDTSMYFVRRGSPSTTETAIARLREPERYRSASWNRRFGRLPGADVTFFYPGSPGADRRQHPPNSPAHGWVRVNMPEGTHEDVTIWTMASRHRLAGFLSFGASTTRWRGGRTVQITVIRTDGSSAPCRRLRDVRRTATAGSDYTAASARSIGRRDASRRHSCGDLRGCVRGGRRDVNLALSNPGAARAPRHGDATLTIDDNDGVDPEPES